jgi:phosphoribosylglycinamide formyltransferase-1
LILRNLSLDTNNRTLGVLISGRGSNLQAISDAIREGRLDATIGVVISNRPEAAGLARARAAGIEAIVLDHKSFSSRPAFEAAVVDHLRKAGVGLVCLAGFMRLIGATLLEAFPGRILNIHPSLLPAFPGVDAQHKAWLHGVKVAGATVHVVNEDLDAGPIVQQGCVAVHDDDTPDSLAARILAEEHRLYPLAIARILDGRFRLEGRRLVTVD